MPTDEREVMFSDGVKRTVIFDPPIEVREVDPKTGGEKGQKDIQLSMLPIPFLHDLGRVYAMGARKYQRDNWLKGYPWHLSYDALMRHITAWWNGEVNDEESGISHLAHAAWHLATLHTFRNGGLGTDDRIITGGGR